MYFLIVLLLLAAPEIGLRTGDKVPLSSTAADALIDSLGRDYYHAKFALYPPYATSNGIRDYDSLLPSFDARGVSGFLRQIKRIEKSLAGFEDDSLSIGAWIDREALRHDMATETFILTDLDIWHTSPMLYADACIDGIYSLIIRLDDSARVNSLNLRLAAVPRLTEQARRNLTGPIRLHCEVASALLKDFLPFLQDLRELPGSDSLPIDGQSLDIAYRALTGFRSYLDSLVIDADPDFHLGYQGLTDLLRIQHMVEDSPDELLTYAESVLAEAKLKRLRYEMYQHRSTVDQPGGGDLTFEDIIDYYYDEIDSAFAFVKSNDLMSLPERTGLRVVRTPAFLRSLIPGYAYQPPGPLDTELAGLLYIPLPREMDPETSVKYRRHLHARCCRPAIVHEICPGHHLQLTLANRHGSFIRSLQHDTFTIEGWAFYCGELMATQGYRGEYGAARMLDGIIFRAARVIVDVNLQLGKFSLDEAVDFMVNQTGRSRDYMEREVRRYAVNPTQAMSYLTGKKKILELRDEFQRLMGSSFSLREFHDTLLSCGSVPPDLLRTCVICEAVGRQ